MAGRLFTFTFGRFAALSKSLLRQESRETMRGTRASMMCILLAGLAALLLAPAMAVGARPGPELDLALCAPGENTFSHDITNSYFPLPVGRQ